MVNNGSGSKLNASITATGDVTLNVPNQVNNSVVQSNASKVNTSQSEKQTQTTNTAQTNVNFSALKGAGVTNTQSAEVNTSIYVEAPQIELPNINQQPFPEFRFPDSPNGLFIYSATPTSRYLVETNPLLTNLTSFLGSDYFLEKIGYNPNADITFLGDAFYDTRIINQAIFEQTGKRYLNESVGTDLAQMQSLIDAAAEAQLALDLSFGISLTEQQVSSLAQDILWYEQITVNGQTVLAPKLYLAQITQDQLSDSAIIAGKNISIGVGKLDNSGSISAAKQLTIISEDTITNDTGTLEAKGDTTLIAKGDITNFSGKISGDEVAVMSAEGSIVNQTLRQQLNADRAGNLVSSDADNITHTTTYLGDTATISSSGKLNIIAGGSVVSVGGDISGGDDTKIQAGDDISFTSVEDKSYAKYHSGSGEVEKASHDYQSNKVTSEGALSISTGNSVTASGGAISAEKNLSIVAGGDVVIGADQTYQLDRFDSGSSKDIKSKSRQEGTSLESGENLNIASGGDTVLVASKLSAEQDINVAAQGKLLSVAAQESDYARTYRESSGLLGDSMSDTEISTTTAKGTTFDADNIRLISRDNQVHQASEITANEGIEIRSAEGKLTFEAVEETSSYRHESVSSGLMVKMEGQGQSQTTQKQTSILSKSGETPNISAALGLQVDYVSTDGHLAKTLAEIPAGEQYQWMALLKDNPNVNWNEVNEAFDEWSYSEQSLSGPVAAVIAIAVTIATSGTGATVASTIGATGTMSSAAVSAATSTLISQASLSFINNGGDLGETFKDLGSSNSVKALATAALTAGAVAGFDSMVTTIPTEGALPSIDGVTQAAGNSNIFTATSSFTPETLLHQLGRSSLQAGIDTAINDTDFVDGLTNSLRGALSNNLGATLADQIGDMGLEHDMANGSFSKAMLHSLTQGAMAELAGGEFAAGAAAGVATELVGDALDSGTLSEKAQVEVAG
ncbi:DUF637 domain-containing protein [Vibrio sonorensis]|uniref:DUF637 domain-containing protein n=1 Tax=Vibrio sonorensis TaxID=1004316 RepID=UPI000AC114E3|nr:DUF637 domain-containing protein [Vibrio sonorensis]